MSNTWAFFPKSGWVQWLNPKQAPMPGHPLRVTAATIVLHNVHTRQQCAGRACVIHNPTDHHMRDWTLIWREDRGIFERICSCGTGHPDPDQIPYWEEIDQIYQAVHGCCGCCRDEMYSV